MATTATYQELRIGKTAIPKIPKVCRDLIGDWTDVRDRRSGEQMDLHLVIKAYGNGVVGSAHVRRPNKWLRMKITAGWFCARAWMYERQGEKLIHVATVRLCHSKREGSVLWQVVGPDESGCLPQEALLWTHR